MQALQLGAGARVRAEVGITVDAGLDVVTDIATTTHHRLLHDVVKLVAATVHGSPDASSDRDHHTVLAHHRTAPHATQAPSPTAVAISGRLVEQVRETPNWHRLG